MKQLQAAVFGAGAPNTHKNKTWTILAAGFFAIACGADDGPSAPATTGGYPGATGGVTGSGGSGGLPASGGVTGATGGFKATGGTAATGGFSATGGALGSGGSSSGGAASGGTSSGGSSSGGTSSGGSASGGTSSGGSATTGGATGSGGSGNTGGQSKLLGWASVSGDGVTTTTGGDKGQTVVATSASQLQQYAESSDALVITFRGTMSVPRLNIVSNKTIRGLDATATIQGGLRIRGSSSEPVSNVIVQNVKVNGASSTNDGDAAAIYFAHHVWLDHLEIWDGPDGNLDIVHASNWVTVSWTKFRYTSNAPDPAHKFSNLIGHSDSNASEDTNRLRVSFHHCWWAEGVVERMPRVRFGNVHVWNSYYSASGNNYGVGAALQSHVLVENNVFEGVNNPHFYYDDEPTAGLLARGNDYQNVTGKQDSGRGSVPNPTYQYTPDAVNTVEEAVKNGAGPK
jgi:pectate lyase